MGKEQIPIQESILNNIALLVSSGLDLPQILGGTVRLITDLVDADLVLLSTLRTVEDHHFFYHARESCFGIIHEKLDPVIKAILNTFSTSTQPILINNSENYAAAFPELLQVRIKSVIHIPLTVGEKHYGMLCVCNCNDDLQLDDRDLKLAETVGKQLAVIIENRKLDEIVQRQNKETDTLRQAAAAVITELDLDQVLTRILINLKKVVDYDCAALYLLAEDHLNIVAERNFSSNQHHLQKSLSTNNPLFRQALLTGKPILYSGTEFNNPADEIEEMGQFYSWIGIPLHMRGRAIGFLTIDRHRPTAYSDSEASLAQAFANEATIALENARLFKELQSLATVDSLTGLWNRRHFFQLAKSEFQRARRYHLPLSAILFDIDAFKVVNDTYGHAIGDQVLAFIAKVCQDNLRHIDLLGRYGGEEFMAVLPNTPLYQAIAVAERLRNIISITPLKTDRGLIHVTASFGVAELEDSCPDVDTLFTYADRAAYTSKFDGKNRVSTQNQVDEL